MPSRILLNTSHVSADGGSMTARFPESDFRGGKEISLTNFSFNNCFYNVSSDLGNNKVIFYFAKWTGNTLNDIPYVCTIADGFYSISDLNYYFQNFFINQGLYLYNTATGNNVYFFSFLANLPLYKFQISSFYVPNYAVINATSTYHLQIPTMPDGSTANIVQHIYPATSPNQTASPWISFSQGNLNSAGTNTLAYLLGFSIQDYGSSTTNRVISSTVYQTNPAWTILSTSAPNINLVTDVIISCNLINSSLQIPSSMLAQVPVTSQYGALTQFQNNNTNDYQDVLQSRFSQVVLKFFDQLGNPLKLIDKNISASLSIK
jgi:hypothetical protein